MMPPMARVALATSPTVTVAATAPACWARWSRRRVRSVSAATSPAGDLVPDGDEELLKAGRGRCRDRLVREFQQVPVESVEGGPDQVVLRREVAVEGGQADAGGARDVVDARFGPRQAEDLLSGADDPRAVLDGVAARWRPAHRAQAACRSSRVRSRTEGARSRADTMSIIACAVSLAAMPSRLARNLS
jgi:hypothetical protein